MEAESEQSTETMDRTVSTVTLTHDSDAFLDARVSERVVREGLTSLHEAYWLTRKRLADLPEGALATATSSRSEGALLSLRDMLVHIRIDSDDECYVKLYASRFSAGDFEAVIAQLKGWLRVRRARVERQVRIGFRTNGERTTRLVRRDIDAPVWAKIASNYSRAARASVEEIVAWQRPPATGNLLLFHGPPGTGKTYVIRALARAWRRWCRFEYIADPEMFFGDAEYMMRVLMSSDNTERARWRLLIIEDAGELLVGDAKAHQGQGLSRLLNLGEGLIGQGLRVLVLISTNDPLHALNEAVARPGRTAAEVEFAPLSVDEANAWLRDRGERRTETPMTLAELYSFGSGAPKSRTESARRTIGLRR